MYRSASSTVGFSLETGTASWPPIHAPPAISSGNNVSNQPRRRRSDPRNLGSTVPGDGSRIAPKGQDVAHNWHWVQMSGVTRTRHFEASEASLSKAPYGQRKRQ